jgi:DNA helicase HerA-like ATPase
MTQITETARPASIPEEIWHEMTAESEAAGGPYQPRKGSEAVGRTMFDLPSSEDQAIVVLLPQERLQELPSQALVRIHSDRDGRQYLGIVVGGPYAEPDGLRADAPLVVATNLQGTLLLPRYHGRVHIAILGEERAGALLPPRYRPLPNSRVEPLSTEETIAVLQAGGDMRLGLAVGHDEVVVGAPSDRKAVLPRHTAFLGTTGSGKSTSVAGFIAQAQAAGIAVVLLDVEGEYTRVHEPAEHPSLLTVLHERKLPAQGIPGTRLYHLVNRDTANPDHPDQQEFCLRFSDLAPYAVAAILDLTEPQQDRFFQAYDIARHAMGELGIFPRRDHHDRPIPEEDREALAWDEFETGYPRLDLSFLLDVVGACATAAAKSDTAPNFYQPALRGKPEVVSRRVAALKPEHAASWRALRSKLWRLHRLRVFDQPGIDPIDPHALTEPGRVSIIDLSDSESPQLNNLAIASLLRGIQRAQEVRYETAVRGGESLARTLVIIEEAHEFLSAERVERMPVLFEQVERIAKRGRKRWLGLCFVTQLPQHLPPAVLGLVNNFILHKISDANVIQRLQRTIPGIDDSLWKRLPALAPGQAIVSLASMTRPLLVSMDPAPCALRMVD